MLLIVLEIPATGNSCNFSAQFISYFSFFCLLFNYDTARLWLCTSISLFTFYVLAKLLAPVVYIKFFILLSFACCWFCMRFYLAALAISSLFFFISSSFFKATFSLGVRVLV
jgi:hypothetical protein